MKSLYGKALPILVLFAALLSAQDLDVVLDGRYEDLRRLPPQTKQDHEFTFVRLIYNGRIHGYYKNWYTDYPKGDRQLIEVLRRLTAIDIATEERAIPISHPDLFDYPFVYSIEGGQMILDGQDVTILREYLSRGGFWMIDDFWGSLEWDSFEKQMKKLFPDRPIVDVPRDHQIFHCFYDIDKVMQVPNIGYAYCEGNCPTWEQDGFEPAVRGIFDENNNLLILITFNTDLMDASEWADEPRYPNRFSTYSYKMFTNAVVYSMTH